jgi:hypothetical protein
MDPIDTARRETRNAVLRIGTPLAFALAIGMVAFVALQSPRARSPEARAAISPNIQAVTTTPALRAARVRPIQFEANLGQAGAEARFIARGPDFSAQVFDDGVQVSRPARGSETNAGAAARLRFVGARTSKRFDARERAEGTTNYMIGADASKWLRNVPSYRQLRQSGLYPGVDLVYYGRDSAFEYDLVVQPGADPSRIRIAVASGARPVIDAQGDLLLDGAGGSLRMHRPVLYQHIDGEKKILDGEYVMLAANEVGFHLPAYDHTRPLVIDPTFKLLYSTYLGGVHDDQVGGMVLDAQNNAYVVGNSGSEDWPVSGNAYQNARKAIGRYVRNVVVTKFDASGTLIYSTFIGGTTNDYGNSIAVDTTGRAYVAGVTNSADFPVTAGAFQSAFRGSQSAYLAVLSSDGASLAYSSLYGGDGGASAMFVGLDAGGKVVLGGSAGTGLPTTTGSYMTSLATGYAAFVARFDIAALGAAQLLAASYYGAAAPQTNFLATGNYGYTLALDAAGAPWLTGQAYTTNLPVTANAVRPSPTAMTPGCSPGSVPLNSFSYVAHLSADLSSLLYASYLSGGNGGPATCAEYGHGLAFDATGNVYVGGSTSSLAYPTTAGTVQPVSPANSGFDGYAGFVTKLKPDGSAILWSTYLGGDRGRTYMSGLTADASGGLWVYAGSAGGSNFPISTDALQKTHGGGTFDASLTRLDAASGAMLYSTFMGGSGDDAAAGFAIDRSGNAYVAGTTASTNFPVTTNAFQPALTANAFDGADWFFSILGSGTIGSVYPADGGNGGTVSLSVTTSGITAATTAALVGPTGTTIASTGVDVDATGTIGNIGFVLEGAAPGTYDLRLTQADGTVLTRPAAFTVAAGGRPDLSVQIVGRPKIRTGKASSFEVTVLNNGSIDAILVPLWLVLPTNVDIVLDGVDIPVGMTGSAIGVENGRYYMFRMLPVVAAHKSVTIPIVITAPTDLASIPMRAILQAPWARTPADVARILATDSAAPGCVTDATNDAFVDCSGTVFAYLQAGVRPLADPSVPSAAASNQALSSASRMHALDLCQDSKADFDAGEAAGRSDAKNKPQKTPNPYWAADPRNWSWGLGYATGQYNAALPGGQSVGRSVAQSASDRKFAEAGGACPVVKPLPPPPPPILPSGTGGSGSGGSLDPNDKFGPMGDGSAAHFMRPAAMQYRIAFENQPTASLPAAEVVVTDQLDASKVDLTTVSLGDISFGSHTIPVPAGLKSYATVYAIDTTMSVRVQGSLNASTGLLKWTFTTIDPLTKLPPSDPTLGFLPPDTDGATGQGYVNFTVALLPALANGTVVSNQASVVFDTNPAILTPTWVNTIDTSVPTSKVQTLTGKPGTMDFDVNWSGTDTGAGVAAYTVYVSDNGGAYAAWQTSTAATGATYTGVSGHSYAFYVRASDGAGNTEAAKSVAEATIAVSGSFADPRVGTSTDSGGCTIGGDGQRDASLPLLVIVAAGLLFIARRRAAAKRRRAAD